MERLLISGELISVELLKSIPLFIVAGFFEIGGGFLIWLWLREGKPFWYGIVGGAILFLYGITATFQASNFARVYATYGGIFITMSLLWAYAFDKYIPDKYDIAGVALMLVGCCLIYYTPHK